MRRVLLVDDSKVTREALQAALEPYGFEVAHAENGASALLLLRQAPFDLAFVDLNMPVLDGPNLIRLMRAQGIATKVILVTSSDSTAVLSSTIKLGASDYVAKPFSAEAIRVAVSRVLGLDPAQLQIRPSRVLLQHPEDALAAHLRLLLPPHVELVSAAVLAKALEAAERDAFEVVLLDARVLEGEVLTAAGPGASRRARRRASLAALSRALQRRAARQGPMAEPSIDLTRAPPFPGRIAALIEEVRARLDAQGAAPAFRVAAGLLEKLTARPELKRAVVFS